MKDKEQLQELTRYGVDAAEKGDFTGALHYLENAFRLADAPLVTSYLGYCQAKERGQVKQGANLCMSAIQRDPGNPVHYLNLGRIYLLVGQKGQAIQILRKGLKAGCDPRIVEALKNLGVRKEPVFAALSRDNPINKVAGLLFARLGFR
ncbi:MAG: tetratricopeptide repeat protein [Deltaproteobacteria bacterium]|nr:tetratricopeptide repeat protein [Deltaproteobacteria bacterium]